MRKKIFTFLRPAFF